MTTRHTFDWHKENEGQGTFLAWFLLHLISEESNKELFDSLSERTDKWHNVELGVTINGVELSTESFIARLDQMMESEVKREAKNMITESVQLRELNDFAYDLTQAFKQRARSAAEEMGIEIDEYEDGWR
jgi:hypothetical protein